MIIGIDASRAVARQRTGTEAYAFFLIQALIPLAGRRGHRLRLYYNQPPSGDLFPAASHVEPCPIPLPRLWTHLRLGWELRQRPPDLFFTPAHVIPLSHRGPSVATVHDLGYHHFPASHPRRQLAYLRWSTRHNARASVRVVADSQATRSDLARFDGIDPAVIDVIYPGIDPALSPETDERRLVEVCQTYGITSPYLLYLGTLQPRKNLNRLIDAYAASGIPHQLVLAGKSGWLSQPILDAVSGRQPSLSGGVILPGFISEKDKAALISGATALLYPSLYEGFGFPVLEAQACGTAVLCANGSSLPEIAGDAALMVDPLDAGALAAGISTIASDADLRRALVQKGFQNVKRFNWQDAAGRVLDTLEKASAAAG
jgi:glycosyltransferase involved in cell wall biosynthesis